MLAAIGLGFLACACGSNVSEQVRVEPAQPHFVHPFGRPGDQPAWYQHAIAATTETDVSAAIPYTKLEFEHVGSTLGSWPSYKVSLARDGRAEYVGNQQAVRTGHFVGNIEPLDFAELCLLFEKADFFAMNSTYTSPQSCGGTDYLRAWHSSDNSVTVVEDNDSTGPLGLWGLQAALQGVAANIHWEVAK
jgi:hypothetical protein